MSCSRRLTLLSIAAAVSAGACSDLPFGGCTSESCARDGQIRADVEKKLEAQPSLKFFNIHVRTYNQVVYLEGLVDTRVDLCLAEAAARSVPGVKEVYNELGLDANSF